MRVDNANNTWKTLATAIATKATDAHKLTGCLWAYATSSWQGKKTIANEVIGLAESISTDVQVKFGNFDIDIQHHNNRK